MAVGSTGGISDNLMHALEAIMGHQQGKDKGDHKNDTKDPGLDASADMSIMNALKPEGK